MHSSLAIQSLRAPPSTRVIQSPGRCNSPMFQAGHLQCFGGDGWGTGLSLE